MLIIFYAWLSLVFLMSAVWIYYRVSDNPSIVDAAWSMGHWLAGTLLLFATSINTRTVVIWLVLTVWAFRLSGYLYWTRVRVGLVDKRYTKLSAQWQMAPALGFFLNFQFQALLILLIVSSLYLNGQSTAHFLNWLDLLGLTISSIAILLETLADLQLRRFVKNNKNKVCDIGFWHYCRHPNYFFEWLVWVGFAVTALSTQYGLISILSPLTLYLIMTRLTGPMTEQGSIESKGTAYRNYQAKTSFFFPWRTKDEN